MDGEDIKIDESRQSRIPSLSERFKNALICAGLGFAIVNLIAFWIFPGLGLAGFYTIRHSYFTVIGDILNVYIVAFLGICALLGWFQGKYVIGRLKGYFDYWKFW